ncbi:unnamed protein product [Ambrosiozyma monospora]|uniref:Unnamed protein product n=1 Tax=Ambrosiozyma monospora TaxID=43982 RepID=A0ACB5SZU6_AMBMO|nr:unnamed protein product [Ambrosiozyma monospora]
MGTDVGGSIRIPALCDGVYGFKPSCDRVPYGNQVNPDDPRDHTGLSFNPCAGPLATTFDNLDIVFRAILGGKPWLYDASTKPVPFMDDVYNEFKNKEVLRIGYFIEDEGFPLHPPLKFAIEHSIERLQKEGYEMVRIDKFPSLETLWRHATRSYLMSFGFWTFCKIFRVGEPPIQALKGTHVEKFGLPPANSSVSRVQRYLLERENLKLQWNTIFMELGLDAIICPAAPHGPVKQDEYGISPYTAMWNVVDFPALVMPLTKEPALTLENAPHKSEYVKGKYSAYVADYKPEETVGACSHIQLVTRNFEDEKLLAISRRIDYILN